MKESEEELVDEESEEEDEEEEECDTVGRREDCIQGPPAPAVP